MCRVIAVSNQKGGVGKTVSCVNLGIGLAQEGRKDDLRKEYSTADVTNRHYQGGFPQTVRRECVGGRGIRWRYSWLILEGEVQRELMPMMPVLMYSVPRMLWSGREISVSCLWDLDASPDTGFYFWKLEGAWYGGFWFHWEIRRTSSQRFSLILNGRFCRSYCKL